MVGEIKRVVDNSTENVKEKNINTNFPAEIKRCRAYLKMTQEKFAEKMKVSISSVRAWEQGKQMPNFENYETLLSLIKGSVLYAEIEQAYLEKKGQ